MGDYKKFIETNFPNSGLNNNSSLETLYKRICENNALTDVLGKYILNFISEHPEIKPEFVFYNNYAAYTNKLLLYLPLGDYSSIHFCLRSSIEQILKFLYSCYFSHDFNHIKKTSFRFLKENFRELNTIPEPCKKSIELLLKYYGSFSNAVHLKVKDTMEITFLEDMIKSTDINLSRINDWLIDIINSYQIIICYKFQIKQEDLSTSDIIRLRNNTSKKRFSNILSQMYKSSSLP